MNNDEIDQGNSGDIVMRTNLETGISWPDPLALTARELAFAAKRWRQAQGLDTVPPIPPDQIDTRPFARRCTVTRTEYPRGAMHRTRYLSVRAGDLPADVRERLRAEGCGPWVDVDEEMIPLGEEMALGQPPPTISVAELVGRIKSSPSPAERRRLRDQESQKRYPGI